MYANKIICPYCNKINVNYMKCIINNYTNKNYKCIYNYNTLYKVKDNMDKKLSYIIEYNYNLFNKN